MWKWKQSTYGWQTAGRLDSLVEWLKARKDRHTDWIDDHSKYIDIRFDSRTGDFIIRHQDGDSCLVPVDE